VTCERYEKDTTMWRGKIRNFALQPSSRAFCRQNPIVANKMDMGETIDLVSASGEGEGATSAHHRPFHCTLTNQ